MLAVNKSLGRNLRIGGFLDYRLEQPGLAGVY